jgi:phenylacetate-CoA ligase
MNYLDSQSHEKQIDLEKSQYWSMEELTNFQNERLRKIIKYAYEKIPGYRKKFDDANLRPNDINTKDDLPKIPITTREELQNNPNFINVKMISASLFTGGSTGASLKYYESPASGKIRWEAHYRGWSWNGYTPGKRLAVIASAQGIVKEKNTLNLIGDLSTENLQENVKKLYEFRPQHLRGYVSSIYILAKYCHDNKISIRDIESINTISENLYEFQREIIEDQFNCKIFDEYCCNDGGACAWECGAHEGLHYYMERAIIEDIDGEMIVTDLWNKAMPFIRYRNGDSVTFLEKRCSCGRELPLMKVKGRTNDILITKHRKISPSFLVHHGIGLVGADKKKQNFLDGIRALQYVQKPGFFLQINIARNSWCTEEDIALFQKTINQFFYDMEIEFNFVDEIPTTKIGKRQFIINEDKKLLSEHGIK